MEEERRKEEEEDHVLWNEDRHGQKTDSRCVSKGFFVCVCGVSNLKLAINPVF